MVQTTLFKSPGPSPDGIFMLLEESPSRASTPGLGGINGFLWPNGPPTKWSLASKSGNDDGVPYHFLRFWVEPDSFHTAAGSMSFFLRLKLDVGGYYSAGGNIFNPPNTVIQVRVVGPSSSPSPVKPKDCQIQYVLTARGNCTLVGKELGVNKTDRHQVIIGLACGKGYKYVVFDKLIIYVDPISGLMTECGYELSPGSEIVPVSIDPIKNCLTVEMPTELYPILNERWCMASGIFILGPASLIANTGVLLEEVVPTSYNWNPLSLVHPLVSAHGDSPPPPPIELPIVPPIVFQDKNRIA